MFRRVTPEEWSQITAMLGFALTFLVFLTALIKAWRMTRHNADHLAALPLEPDTAIQHPNASSTPDSKLVHE